jgi:hypothetical protein
MPLYLSAQNYMEEEFVYPALKLDLPLFDYPYQINAMNTVGRWIFRLLCQPQHGAVPGSIDGYCFIFPFWHKSFI